MADRLGVIHAHELVSRRSPVSLAITPFSMRSSKNAMSSARSASTVCEDVLQQRLGEIGVVGELQRTRSPARSSRTRRDAGSCSSSRRGTSGRTCRPCDSARQYASTLSWPDTVRNASRPKKSCAKSTLPSAVRGRFARSSVDTRNSAPAPSASDAVMIGVLTQQEAVLVEEAVDRLARSCAARASARR